MSKIYLKTTSGAIQPLFFECENITFSDIKEKVKRPGYITHLYYDDEDKKMEIKIFYKSSF